VFSCHWKKFFVGLIVSKMRESWEASNIQLGKDY